MTAMLRSPALRSPVMIALIAILLAATVLKLNRYGHEPSDGDAPFLGRLVSFMQAHGWVVTSPAGGHEHGAFAVHTFGKAGCERRFMLVVMGPHNGLEALIRRDFGPGMVFLQNGVVIERPIMWRFHAVSLVKAFGRSIGVIDRPYAPLVALSEAPGHARGLCALPKSADWRILS